MFFSFLITICDVLQVIPEQNYFQRNNNTIIRPNMDKPNSWVKLTQKTCIIYLTMGKANTTINPSCKKLWVNSNTQ